MTREIEYPKTPTVAVQRVLKTLGLVQGRDFRVTGHYVNGERRYTFAYTLTEKAARVVADNADMIEEMTALARCPFRVSVRYHGTDDRPTVDVRNAGHSVRETPPAPAVVEEPAADGRTMVADEIGRNRFEIYTGTPSDDTYVGHVFENLPGVWAAYRTPVRGVENPDFQRDANGRLLRFDSAQAAAAHLVPDAAPVDTSGPKGQEAPPAPRHGGFSPRAYEFTSLPTQERQDAVRARAGALYRAGTHSPMKAWDAALKEDWSEALKARVLPAEDTFEMCASVLGGAVDTHTAVVDGDYPVYPLCRTMGQNSRGTHYQVVTHGDITCTTCLGYRAGREAHRAAQG
jgi:hypothetical protein